jgi:hypothetical protein
MARSTYHVSSHSNGGAAWFDGFRSVRDDVPHLRRSGERATGVPSPDLPVAGWRAGLAKCRAYGACTKARSSDGREAGLAGFGAAPRDGSISGNKTVTRTRAGGRHTRNRGGATRRGAFRSKLRKEAAGASLPGTFLTASWPSLRRAAPIGKTASSGPIQDGQSQRRV